MIKLSNGHELEWVVASGAFGFDGRGWAWEKPLFWSNIIDPSVFTITLKTITWRAKKRNGAIPVRFIKNGVVNAVGLENPGTYQWVQKYAPRLNPDYNYILSLTPESDLSKTLAWLDTNYLLYFDLFKAVEINASCPNFKEFSIDQILSWCSIIKNKYEIPVILKIGAGLRTNILKDSSEFIEAVSINSVPWTKFVEMTSTTYKESPLAKWGGGGVSGRAAYKINKLVAAKVMELGIPVIGASAWDWSSVNELLDMGCGAISFGSIFMRKPWWPNQVVKTFKELKRGT